MTLSFVSIIFFILVAEIFVRISHIVDLRVYDPIYRTSKNKELVYELKPNFKGRGYGAKIKTNSYGLRDSEFTLTKPPHTYRIVMLGDSFTFGYGVERKDTFAERLEDMLNSNDLNAHVRFEVINCGVMGYNTVQERAFFESVGVKFQPDLVIIYTIDNDFGKMSFREHDGFLICSKDRVESIPERIRFELARRSYLFKLIFGWLRSNKKKFSSIKMASHSVGKIRHPLTSWEVASQELKERRVNDLKKIAILSKEINAKFLIVLHDFNKNASDFIKSSLEGTDAHILDMSPFWKNQDAGRLVIKHDIHPNKDGHLFIAQRIFEKLKSEELVPFSAN